MIFHSGGFTTNLVLIICLDNKGQKMVQLFSIFWILPRKCGWQNRIQIFSSGEATPSKKTSDQTVTILQYQCIQYR